jgi:hypothetical protein
MVEPKEVEDEDEEAAAETRRGGEGGGGGGGGGGGRRRDVERASPHTTSLVLDDSGRIRLLHPSRPISLREICRASSSFRSKITQFHQVQTGRKPQNKKEVKNVPPLSLFRPFRS